MATIINSSDFVSKIAEGVVLVDFFAEWCGPCMAIAPTIDELAHDYEGKAGVFKVNVDESQDLAMQFGVMSIPTLMVFKDGTLVDKVMGAMSKSDIKALIDKYLV